MVDPELSCIDALLLENQFPRGGLLASVNSASETAHWLEAHDNHPLLLLLRAVCSPGPVPIAISPEESGFAVFCSRFTVPMVEKLAQRLAKLSGFVVLLRRASENPIPVLRAARRKTRARDGEETLVDPESRMTGVYHTSALDLKLRLGGNTVHDIKICSDLQTHIFEPSSGWFRSRHELGSFVSSEIVLHPHQAVFDRSYTNIGLLVHRRRHGSVLQTDLHFWVHDPALPSRVRGLLVSTSTYVPDALTEKRLLAQGNANVEYPASESHPPAPKLRSKKSEPPEAMHFNPLDSVVPNDGWPTLGSELHRANGKYSNGWTVPWKEEPSSAGKDVV
ncbi:hypothetical protein FB45DRAFT_1061526 [Roridomyces roridus]|uniref:Uncharacterized protein n=1 Tax=Roridomyces roridus TaxID=1738132 RepID=A0AAD7FJF3_9AGAR|nr:hypothetical protein FB45DRAFT_1061526 [Roridomyces roridus]